MKTSVIGKVRLTWLKSADIKSEQYSDGDDENKLLNIYKSKNKDKAVKEALIDPSWAIYYHLSPLRHNVVDWHAFKKGSRVLEIGAGCGAVTEGLLKQEIDVTALELTERRALINAHRNKEKDLTIVVGNLEEFSSKEKFDYIVCIGVLEYAGSFISTDNPYDEFLNKVSSLLKPNGKLILAIENQTGLKYFAGAREDHTGGFFDSLNRYPAKKKVQTFGRKELSELLQSSGFDSREFYFPFPDYKHPQLVYSDKHYPGLNGVEFPLSLLPAPAKDHSRTWLFSEALAMTVLERNNLFRDFSNSFIVLAGKKDLMIEKQSIFFTSQPLRKKAYQTTTSTYINPLSGRKTFRKVAVHREGIKHIHSMLETQNFWEKQSLKLRLANAERYSEGAVEFEYIDGSSLERTLLEAILTEDSSQIDLVSLFVERVREMYSQYKNSNSSLKVLPIDLNFDNIIIDKKKQFNLIDYEWTDKGTVSPELIIQRALYYFFSRNTDTLKYFSSKIDMIYFADSISVPKLIYDNFIQYFTDFKELNKLENKLQSEISGFEGTQSISKVNNRTLVVSPALSVVEQYLNIPSLEKNILQSSEKLSKLESEYLKLKYSHDRLQARWKKVKKFLPVQTARAIQRKFKKSIL